MGAKVDGGRDRRRVGGVRGLLAARRQGAGSAAWRRGLAAWRGRVVAAATAGVYGAAGVGVYGAEWNREGAREKDREQRRRRRRF
jgi:hypothetical protein